MALTTAKRPAAHLDPGKVVGALDADLSPGELHFLKLALGCVNLLFQVVNLCVFQIQEIWALVFSCFW